MNCQRNTATGGPNRLKLQPTLCSFVLLLLFTPALAEPPTIKSAQARLQSNQLYTIAVTLQHNDTGWDHYASEWTVIGLWIDAQFFTG